MRRTRRKGKRRVKTREESEGEEMVWPSLLRDIYTAFSMYMIISLTLLFDLSLLLCAFFFIASKKTNCSSFTGAKEAGKLRSL